MSNLRSLSALVVAALVGMASAACGQSPVAPSVASGQANSSTEVRTGAKGPQASVTLDMGDLAVTIVDGTSDTAKGTIAVVDNHLDPAKQVTFSVTDVQFLMETKTTGRWGAATGSCTFTVDSETGLASQVSYTCTGAIDGSNAIRVTATVEITDVFGNVLYFTARASAKLAS